MAMNPNEVTPRGPQSSGLRVAYIMSRFPKLTETFVLDEMLELERQGASVEVFPLWREKAKVIHPEARALVARAHFTRTLDLPILRDNFRAFARGPGVYLRTLVSLVLANRRSPRFLLAALALFPKACHFAERMRALEIDHVHAHFASHPAAAAFVIGRLSTIPWSFTAHGSDLYREQSMLLEKVREARAVIAISEHNRDFILNHVGTDFRDKVRVVHCGVDTQCYADPDTVRDEDQGKVQYEIVCVGTLHEVKGQTHLLAACADLTEQGIAWRCHLIGDGPDRQALENQARALGIGERVLFHGHCEREEVRRLLGQMDVAVAPSVPTRDGRREGIPVALMEAAASALPLIGSRLSGIPELISHNEIGLLVEPGDVRELALALTRLADDPAQRRRLGKAAFQKLARDFSLERSVASLRTEIFTAIPS